MPQTVPSNCRPGYPARWTGDAALKVIPPMLLAGRCDPPRRRRAIVAVTDGVGPYAVSSWTRPRGGAVAGPWPKSAQPKAGLPRVVVRHCAPDQLPSGGVTRRPSGKWLAWYVTPLRSAVRVPAGVLTLLTGRSCGSPAATVRAGVEVAVTPSAAETAPASADRRTNRCRIRENKFVAPFLAARDRTPEPARADPVVQASPSPPESLPLRSRDGVRSS